MDLIDFFSRKSQQMALVWTAAEQFSSPNLARHSMFIIVPSHHIFDCVQREYTALYSQNIHDRHIRAELWIIPIIIDLLLSAKKSVCDGGRLKYRNMCLFELFFHLYTRGGNIWAQKKSVESHFFLLLSVDKSNFDTCDQFSSFPPRNWEKWAWTFSIKKTLVSQRKK